MKEDLKPTKEQLELLRVVAEDLKFLKETWDQEISDSSLRISSPVLRRLLVEGDLLKAARLVGYKEIKVRAPTNPLSFTQIDRTILYQSGGARFKNMAVQSFSLLKGKLGKEEIKSRSKVNRNQTYKLSNFLEAPSFIVLGRVITRNEVIKYVANKKGGAHFDPRRDGGRKALEQKFGLLDKVMEKYKTADKNSVYFELLSIGQALIKSRHIERLRKKLEDAIGLTNSGRKI